MRLQVRPSALISFAAVVIPGRVLLGTWREAILFALLIGLSLLLHELGHAAVARRYGVTVKAIGFAAAGAYTIRDKSSRKSVEVQAALAGPLVNSALAFAFFCIPGSLAHLLAMSNLILAITNMLPIAPSDGWRMWRLLLR